MKKRAKITMVNHAYITTEPFISDNSKNIYRISYNISTVVKIVKKKQYSVFLTMHHHV